MSKPTRAHDARTCPNCGKTFTPRHKAQRYCTNRKDGPGSCQKMAERERARQRGRKTRKVKMVCHHCEAEFMGERKKRVKGSHEHYYCSHACYSEYRRWGFRKHFSISLDWRECKDCSTSFISRNGRQSCPACRDGQRAPGFVWAPVVCDLLLTCKECSELFVGRWNETSPALFCSNACSKRWRKRKQRKLYGRSTEHRKRARRYGVAYEPIKRNEVFERDGYRCGLCGELTDTNAQVPDPRAPTLDHILPMSMGGGHLYDNVQCACFECNWKKGATAPQDVSSSTLPLEFSV